MRHLHGVDWPAMQAALAELPHASLLAAGLLGAASYAVYCSFDLLARRVTGHSVPRLHVLAIAFVGHACALSLGPPGAGVRFRLSAHHGMPAHLTAALWLFNVATNWLGFAALAGAALATGRIALPARWGMAGDALQAAGFALLAAVALYLLACRAGRHRRVVVRGVEFRLPPLSVALSQCALSVLNWLLLAGMLHALLDRAAPFEAVLGALMASALALAVIDVPAGLGVIETVFVTLLGSMVAPHRILAALMAYRAIYFVGPLALGALVAFALEWHAHARDGLTASRRSRGARSPRHATDGPRPPPRRPS
jgi:uncharacterized membrane protein YbhN (UPF0104 family)